MKNSGKLSFFLMWAVTISVHAEVVTDGTVGAVQNLSDQMVIPQSLGTTVGNNLFHSFQTFNINTDESATFTGADNLKNVISRVTGGQVSNIDGLLKSEIPNANFYFINPAGVTFGWNATVDVPAAFHVSTANSLKFADGTEFSASNPSASVLTIAEPESFGFVGNQTADINFYNWFQFNQGNDVSFSASNLLFDYAWLDNPSGSVQINAIGNIFTELPFNAQVTTLVGDIKLINDSWLDVGANGSIQIQGGNILLDNSAIRSRSNDADNAGNVSLVTHELSILNGSRVDTNASGTGVAGSITATAKNISVDSRSSISSVSQGGGGSGGILLHTDSLQNDGIIQSSLSGDVATVPAQIVTDGSQGSDSYKGREHTLTTQAQIQGLGYGMTAYLYDSNSVVEYYLDTFSPVNPVFTVPQEMGTTVGDNLFHSFSVFNINQHETVSFTGADSLKNVISRVTGGEVSTINGLLKSEIPNANFYFINPAGVTFSANAKLDVPAAFHLSTADSVKFTEGHQFSATNLNGELTVAEPKSFVFLDSSVTTIGNITIEGPFLDVREGNTLDMVANNFEIKNTSYLTAPAGEMRLVAFKNAGEVSVQQDNTGKLSLPDAMPLASNAGKISLDSSYVYSDGNRGGGHTALWANEIVLDHGSAVAAWNYSDDNATSSQGIEVQAHDVNLYNQSYISTAVYAGGNAGTVSIIADALGLFEGGSISANTYAAGSAGVININADTVNLFGNEQTGIFSETTRDSTGDGGVININSNVMNILASSKVSARSYSNKGAGTINLTANNELTINGESGYLPGIWAESYSGTGAGGHVNIINHGKFDIVDGLIAVSSLGTGHSGSISISAGEFNLSNSNGNNILSAEAVNSLKSSGVSGNISITADSLNMTGVGRLMITSTHYGDADAGNIEIKAKNITLDNANNGILAETHGVGNAGTITIIANDNGNGSLNLFKDSKISTNSLSTGKAGNILIAADTIDILDQGKISASSYSSGDAGNVFIAANNLTIDGQNYNNGSFNPHASHISTDAFGLGAGGSININADTLDVLSNGSISASAFSFGNAGAINIITDSLNINGNESTGLFVEAKLSSTGHAGTITVNSNTLNILGSSKISAGSYSSSDAGTINITANDLLNINNINGYRPGIWAESSRDTVGGNAGNITIKNSGTININGGLIATSGLGSGHSGTIDITAGALIMSSDDYVISSEAVNSLKSSGTSGNIVIKADELNINGLGTFITTSTYNHDADAGDIEITAKKITLDGGGQAILSKTFLWFLGEATGTGTGNAGKITINAMDNGQGTLNILNGSSISTAAEAVGDAGNISIKTDILNMSGNFSKISSNTIRSGKAGSVEVIATKNINLDNRAEISSSTFGTGKAGDVTVNSPHIALNNAEISALAGESSGGETGEINVNAGTIDLTNNSKISIQNNAVVENLSAVAAGAAGAVMVTASDINLKNSSITAQSTGNVDAGRIEVNFSHQLYLDPSYITTSANLGNGGSITINSDNGLINLQNSGFFTSVAGATGNGGNINVSANTLIMDTGAIQANAVRGSGGDINLNLKALIPSQNQLIKGGTQVVWQPFVSGFNVIQAASASGINGSVNISSPQFNISGSISGLGSAALVLPIIDNSLCQGSTIPTSALVHGGKGGIPDDGLQFSFVPALNVQNVLQQAQDIMTTYSMNIKPKSLPCMAL